MTLNIVDFMTFKKECEYNCIPDKDTNQLKNQTTIPSEIEINQPNLTNVMRLLNKLYETDIIFDFNDIYEYIVQSLSIDKYYLYLTLDQIINNKIVISKNTTQDI